MPPPLDKTRSSASRRILELLDRGEPAPWQRPDLLAQGLPRNGTHFKVYGGINPLLLWTAAAGLSGASNLWLTRKAGERLGGRLQEGAAATAIVGSKVHNLTDFEGLESPVVVPAPSVAVRRVTDLLRFLGVDVREGSKVTYDFMKDAITVDSGSTLMTPAGCATLMPCLVWWTQRRRDVANQGAGWLTAELGGALLCAWLQLSGAPPEPGPWGASLSQLLRDEPATLWDCLDEAQDVLRYVQDLTPQFLVDELEAAARGERLDPEDDETADLSPLESVRSLGDMLRIDPTARAEAEKVESKPKRLVLGERPGGALRSLLDDLATHDLGRRRPPVVGWISGSGGTGRIQVVSAIRGLVQHGGTDLSAPWLDTEGEAGKLLDAFGAVWSRPEIEVVFCRLPSRFHVRHDRAVPTACLQAFHQHRGLSNRLWLSRLEHVLQRNDGYGPFVKAFEALASVKWVGVANQNPIPHKERLISALGGALAGARRRVRHYQATRKEASWDALFEEVSTSLHARAEAMGWTPDDPEPRVLFVVDLSSAEVETDPAARGWLGRTLAPIPDLMDDLATRGTRPFWFLFCSEGAVRELADLASWDKGARRIKHVADLDRYPVTSAFNQELLAKVPSRARPMYQLWADQRESLRALSTLEGYATPVPEAREDFLAAYPFLPPVLPMAQAVLDTLVTDPSEADPRPLSALVEHALAEHYYAPPDRFIPFDVLLEPVLERLRSEDRRKAAARVMVPVAASSQRVFGHDTVLATLRLAGRIPEFPCTARNLVSLMYVRPVQPVDDLIAEVEDTLRDLASRRLVKRSEGRYTWLSDL